jgi:transcriptional regulator with XRE-family HTH domain
MSIGGNIEKQRKKLRMSRRELSEKTGLAMKTIQRYESGENSPTAKNLEKVAAALDVQVSDLADEKKVLTFGSFLKERREILGLTEKDVAEAVNMSAEKYNKLENDLVVPHPAQLEELFDVLDVKDTKDIIFEIGGFNYELHSRKEKINDLMDTLNNTGRRRLLEYAEELAQIPKYSKSYTKPKKRGGLGQGLDAFFEDFDENNSEDRR